MVDRWRFRGNPGRTSYNATPSIGHKPLIINHFRSQKASQFKAGVVLEVLAGLESPSEIARQHKPKPELIARWKDIAPEGPGALLQGEGQRVQDQDPSIQQCAF
jgi:hypothetical protein